jgi:catechol 2,3-dioxygenase-like lactoylglutathione lyase family enzyme
MRCLAQATFGAGRTAFEQVRQSVDEDGLATHGHPRALVGARFFSWAVWWALTRQDKLGYGELIDRVIAAEPKWSELPRTHLDWHEAQKRARPLWEEEWLQAVEESLRYLTIARDSLHQGALAIDRETLEQLGFFGREKGAGTVTAAAAIFLATRYTSQPQQGLLAAAFTRNSDSDTLASMTGGLLGALAGGDWLGSLPKELQDSHYVKAVAAWLSEGEGPQTPTLQWHRPMKTDLKRELASAAPGDTIRVPLFGPSEVARIQDHDTRSNNFIRTWLLSTAIGQSLSIKAYDRGRDGQSPWTPLSRADKPSVATKQIHAGLVREVSDLDAARRFYEDVVGLTKERSSSAFVSFGWLALELPSGQGLIKASQLALPDSDELSRSRQAIRVYIDAPTLAERHAELAAAGLPVGPVVEREGRARFRCADPDGYVVEFCARNGSNRV